MSHAPRPTLSFDVANFHRTVEAALDGSGARRRQAGLVQAGTVRCRVPVIERL